MSQSFTTISRSKTHTEHETMSNQFVILARIGVTKLSFPLSISITNTQYKIFIFAISPVASKDVCVSSISVVQLDVK